MLVDELLSIVASLATIAVSLWEAWDIWRRYRDETKPPPDDKGFKEK